MRWLIRLIVLLSAIWAGYWFVGSRALEAAARDWFAAAPSNGFEASYQDLTVLGFPNRFDLTVTQPRFTDRAQDIRYEAPFLQLFSLSYRPWHLIAAMPPEQRLTLPGDALTLRAAKLQASLVVEPSTALALDRLVVIGDALSLVSDSGLSLQAETVHFATRQDPTRENAHELGLEITALRPDPGLMRKAQAADLPEVIEKLNARILVDFTAPLDRTAAQTRPQIAALDIRDSRATWGDISVSAEGTLQPDALGFAEGQVTLRLTNWEKALQAAADLGLVAPDSLASLRNAAQFLVQQSSEAGQLDLPLTFGAGQMRFGPFTIGPAPRLR
ncbi:MAG: hypothetical protein ACJASV_002866 [Pseudorhodobacter sp.]|jgi:hypothetical protein